MSGMLALGHKRTFWLALRLARSGINCHPRACKLGASASAQMNEDPVVKADGLLRPRTDNQNRATVIGAAQADAKPRRIRVTLSRISLSM